MLFVRTRQFGTKGNRSASHCDPAEDPARVRHRTQENFRKRVPRRGTAEVRMVFPETLELLKRLWRPRQADGLLPCVVRASAAAALYTPYILRRQRMLPSIIVSCNELNPTPRCLALSYHATLHNSTTIRARLREQSDLDRQPLGEPQDRAGRPGGERGSGADSRVTCRLS
ncbi:hypothetical protein L209DRAFT_142578 [Thermothelomyces heterothallicus CBS 203.75]